MNPKVEQTVTSQPERCDCGKLLTVLTERGVEILCRGCKRTHRLAWSEEARIAAAASSH